MENQVAKLEEAVFGPTAVTHKVGLHLNNIARVNQGGWNVLDAIKPTAVLNLPGGASVEDIDRVLRINPRCHVFIRPYYVPHDDEASKEQYIQTVVSMIQGGAWNIIPEGQRHLQLFNEQNMPRHSQYEGFGVNLKDMILFDRWFCIGYDRVKQVDPTWKVGWTPLTPGNRDVFFPSAAAQNTAQMFKEMIYHKHKGANYSSMSTRLQGLERTRLDGLSKMAPCDTENVPYYMHGLEAAKANPTQEDIRRAVLNGPCYKSLYKADEYIAHIYSMSPEHQIDKDWCGLRFVMYARFFPKPMDVWIMECGIGGEPHWICDWFQILQSYPAVQGTAIWKLGAEIIGINEQMAALRDYTRNLPPTLGQPLPWPQPIIIEPPPEPPPPEPPPPDTEPPFLCGPGPSGGELVTTTEVNCLRGNDDAQVIFRHFGLSLDAPANDVRRTFCEWANTYPAFIEEHGTLGEYLVKIGCREAPPEPPEPEPPTVDFYGVPTSGVAPLTVQFYNTSVGEYDAIRWDFGDGRISALENPSHVYLVPGIYDVRLTLYQGDQPFPLTKPGYIEVLEKPEPEPPPVRRLRIAISGALTLTVIEEIVSDEPPIDADGVTDKLEGSAYECMLASEEMLRTVWPHPDEDEAWSYLEDEERIQIPSVWDPRLVAASPSPIRFSRSSSEPAL